MNDSEATVLALDAHGGDHGLPVTVPAALQALKADECLRIILVGRPGELKTALSSTGAFPDVIRSGRLEIHPCDSVIPMDARPAQVLRQGRNSSMWNAFELVSQGKAGACVSGGSTAAMMLLGIKLIGRLPGVQRPALMGYVPNTEGHTGFLDLGANLQVSAQQLVQFAVMGSVTASLVEGLDRPRVGLLNVGHEDSKGHDLVREAHNSLLELPIEYTGFIEGHDIFAGKVDIAVCDGFAGNLILKSSEGLARMMHQELKIALSSSAASRLGAFFARNSLRRLLARMNPSAHNGAPLLGLNGVVVKSHGGAGSAAMTQAILEGGREARRGVPARIDRLIHEYHLEAEQ